MDKREYQEKLQEINSLIAAEDYEGAAKVADSIDWKRVRNVQTLVMISEVYEALGRYNDSKTLLLRAYRRSPLGRTVLYRLVECTIKLGQYDQAIEYYSEYVQAAPHDNNKYILKYKIYRARGSSLDEQIDILKDYLDQEYNEKWAYELARLQVQADRVQEGLATCDDLVLWFHSGKYVIKALELKKKYAPLTPKQQEIYDNRFEDEEEEEDEVSPGSYLSEVASLAKAERAAAAQEEIKSELAVDISHTAQMEASKEELSRKAEEAQAEIERTAAESEKALARNAQNLEKMQVESTVPSAAGARNESGSENSSVNSAADAKEQSAEDVQLQSSEAEAAASASEKTSGKGSSGIGVFKKMGNSVAGFFSRDKSDKKEAATGSEPAVEEEIREEVVETPDTLRREKPVNSAVDAIRDIAAEADAHSAEATQAIEDAAALKAAEVSAEAEAEVNAEAAQDMAAVAEETAMYAQMAAAGAGTMAMAQELAEEATASAQQAAEAAADKVEETAQAAETATADMVEDAEDVAQTAQAAVAESVEDATQTAAAETVEDAAQTAQAAAAENVEDAAQAAQTAASKAADHAAEAAEDVADAAEDTAETAQTAEAKTAEPETEDTRTAQEKQEDMVRSMREIVSGVGPKDQMGEDEAVLDETIEQSKEDQENAVAARGADMTFRVPVSEASQKRSAGKLTIDDILLSMSDGGSRVREVTGGSVMSAEEESQMTAQQQAEAKAASYDAELGSENPEIPKFLREDVHEAKNTAEIPSAEIARADDAMRSAMGLASRDQAAGQGDGFTFDSTDEGGNNDAYAAGSAQDDRKLDKETLAAVGMLMGAAAGESASGDAAKTKESAGAKTSDLGAAAEAAALMDASKVPYTKEIAEAKTRRLPVDEIRKLHEAYLSENAGAAEEAAKNASSAAEKAAEMAEAEVVAANDPNLKAEDIDAVTAAAAAGGMAAAFSGQTPGEGDEDMKIAGAPGEAAMDAGAWANAEEAGQEDNPAMAQEVEDGLQENPAEEDLSAAASGTEEAMPADAAEDREGIQDGEIGEQVTREVPKSAPEPQVLTGKAYLKDNQMDLFRGFTSIGNLSEQIAGAIWQAEHRKDDRTSRSGNILILGAHGCGKTTIATGIAKAIAEDKGTHSVKMARIYAADLNRKDIAATIAKIAGGVLIVEEAGDLDDAIVDQLTTAMEFRTDGMIMILEDEQRYIHDLLMRHPRFTMKFTAQIYIPDYSAQDLVNFGKIYAESQDYVFSEKAVEACMNRIEAAKKSSEAVSVTNMIELVDRAIKNANTFFRRIGSSKKRYDDQDRIILLEKDFR